MSESGMWTDSIRPIMVKWRLDPVRVENVVDEGFPDVDYAFGTLELKYRATWPVREKTIVSLSHFTPQQRVWLRRRWEASRNAWLLFKCEETFMLFSGYNAQKYVGLVDKKETLARAIIWSTTFDHPAFKEFLIGGGPKK